MDISIIFGDGCAGRWLLVTDRWMLDTGYSILDAIAHSVQADNSEISETSNAMPSAPCALPLKSEIPNPKSEFKNICLLTSGS